MATRRSVVRERGIPVCQALMMRSRRRHQNRALTLPVPPPRTDASAAAPGAATASLAEMTALARDHRRIRGSRVFRLPRGPDRTQHRFHRRRLRQRPRDLGCSPGLGAGEPGVGRRQLPCEKGGLAGPARQGALPGSSRHQEGRRGRGRNGPRGGSGTGAQPGGPGPGLSFPTRTHDRRRSHAKSPTCAPTWRATRAKRRSWCWGGPT